MAIGRITGPMLNSNLDRQVVNIAIEGNILYVDVVNRRIGVNTIPTQALDINGAANIAGIVISGNTISGNTGTINFSDIVNLGSITNVQITGGSPYNLPYTNGFGSLQFDNLASIAALSNFTANNLPLGTSAPSNDGFGTSALTTGMSVSEAVGLLDDIIGNISNVSGNVITTANLFLTTAGYTNVNNVLITDGIGQTSFIDANTLPAIIAINASLSSANNTVSGLLGNTIQLGSNSAGYLVSNATSLTTTTSITNAISELNYVLGKLVPPSPPPFPGANVLALTTSTTSALMTNYVQPDNSGWGNLSISAGSAVNAVRTTAYATGTTISAVGPGNTGTVTAYLNGKEAGNVALTGSSNGTYGNLIIANNQDYRNVVTSVAGGFWYSFDARAAGNAPSGWNRVHIRDSATNGNTNVITWFYDSAAPGTPTFSNTSIALTTNTVVYSSTIPMLTNGALATLKGNVSALSGNTYPNSSNLTSSTSAGGAFQAPSAVAYASAGITAPLAQNLYVSSGSAYFQTTAGIISSGFGSSSTGPALSVNNSYSTGSATFSPGVTILYKNGTSNNVEETSIPVTSVGTGSGNAYRIENPGSGDTPAYTGSEAAFNSTSGPFYTYDATNVAARIKFDQTNYSTGHWPIGPDLSAQGTSQYFTFKFVRTAVSKFNINWTGTVAGMWIALPGQSDTYSGLNGWYSMSSAYAGSGAPGTGPGGNGSDGCSLGGFSLTGGSYTATLGTLSSTNSTGNEIYVRIKLTSGQSISALSIVAATN
jgi:hypothetical protein